MHGVLLVDKPEGVTSAGVVRVVKRIVKPAKVGHSGTLDPAASGLLIVMIGAAPRIAEYLPETPKHYSMNVRLGVETDSCDREGTVLSRSEVGGVTLEAVQAAVKSQIGMLEQIPPHFSAIKQKGTPLYKLARKGIFPEVTPRRVEVYSLDVVEFAVPFLKLDLACSKGTYARSIARDIGRILHVGGTLDELRRTRSGSFHLNAATRLDDLQNCDAKALRAKLLSIESAIPHIAAFPTKNGDAAKLAQGGFLEVDSVPDKAGEERIFKVVDTDANTIILAKIEYGPPILLKPIKVLKTA